MTTATGKCANTASIQCCHNLVNAPVNASHLAVDRHAGAEPLINSFVGVDSSFEPLPDEFLDGFESKLR